MTEKFTRKMFGCTFKVIINKPRIIAKLVPEKSELSNILADKIEFDLPTIIGKATCSKEDTFNTKYGATLAITRAFANVLGFLKSKNLQVQSSLSGVKGHILETLKKRLEKDKLTKDDNK